jgi:predicted MFS family arabinose efflux permease
MLVAAAGAALEIPPLLPAVLAGDVVFGAAIPWLVVGLISLAQRVTPPELQGRVYAAVETLITTPQTISIALGAALITVTGYQTLLLAMAATIALAAIYLLTRPEQRQAARRRTRTAATTSPASQRTHTTPVLPGNGHTAGPLDSAGAPSQTAPGT